MVSKKKQKSAAESNEILELLYEKLGFKKISHIDDKCGVWTQSTKSFVITLTNSILQINPIASSASLRSELKIKSLNDVVRVIYLIQLYESNVDKFIVKLQSDANPGFDEILSLHRMSVEN